MGWLRGKKTDKPDYTGLQLQTAAAFLPIPIVWGTNKVSHNVIFYDNFQSHKGGSKLGKGGHGGGGSSSSAQQATTYTCDIALGICEGPISGFGLAWKDQAEYAGPFGLWMFGFNGTTPQPEWGYFQALYPGLPLNFPGTAVVVGADVQLGAGAVLGNINWEILGVLSGTGANGIDADPAQVVYDFLTNAQYGAGFDASLIDSNSLFGANGVSQYCHAMGISISPVLIDQEQASSTLTRWLEIINCAAVWSGEVLRFVPYGDTPIAPGLVKTTTTAMSIPPVPEIGFGTQTSTGDTFTTLTLNPPGGNLQIVSIQYATAYYGAYFINLGWPLFQGSFGVAGNTLFFNQYDAEQAIIITYTYTTAYGYTPDLTPVYSLTDDDYIDEGGDDQDPVVCTRVDPFSLSTIMRLECTSRINRYSPVTVEARDQGQIELYGPRIGTSIQAREICDELNVGPLCAQLILQRQLYVRANFKFKVDWTFCLLDPMDMIAISDATLGLDDFVVRIVSIEEDDKGFFEITAEELAVGASDTPLYGNATITTPPINRAASVGAVNAPVIYEPLSGYSSTPEVLLGASSSLGNGKADPNWGGADVWASLDGSSYAQIASINGATPQGHLTAYLASASGWDTTNTLSVDLTESGGTLTGTTQAGAQGGVTLCLIDNELIGYATATLTAPHKYNLTGLARGLFGTTPQPHGTGAPFARLDTSGPVVTYALPTQWIGATLYFKFQSFNLFGASAQDLSACTPYVFTATGPAVPDPIAAQLLTGTPVDLGLIVDLPTVSDDFGSVLDSPEQIIDLGHVAVVSYPIAAQLLAALESLPVGSIDFGLITGSVTLSDDFGSVLDPPLDNINLGTVP
jgi:putative tail protein